MHAPSIRITNWLSGPQWLLVLVTCVAACMASYVHRLERVASLKQHPSIEMWFPVRVKSNLSRMTGKFTEVHEQKFQYPFLVEFGSRESSHELFQCLPLCDGLHSICWQKSTLSASEAGQLAKQGRCRALHLRRVESCSDMLAQVSQMSQLRELALDTCQLTQADIQLLAKAQQLAIVIFSETNVTKEQIHFLRDAMPGTFVVCMDWK